MSRTASLLVGLICFGLAGLNEIRSAPKRASRPPQPVPTTLQIDPPASDFGEVGPGETLWLEATVTNPLGSPVRILDVSKSCSCAESDVTDNDLAAGGKTTLRVGWRMAGKRGPVRETVRVRYQVGERTEVSELNLRAVVKPDASYAPTSLRFGKGEDPPEQVVTFSADRPGVSVIVQEVVSSVKAVRASIDPDNRTVRVRFDPTAAVVDGIRHTLLVRVTGFEGPWVQVPLEFDLPGATN